MNKMGIMMCLMLSMPLHAGDRMDDLKTDDQKIIYTLGVMVGRNVSSFNLKSSELKYLMMGLKDTVEGKQASLDMGAYSAKFSDFQAVRRAGRAQEEKAKSKAYLEKAAKDKRSSVSPSGLVYTDLVQGTGPSPSPTDTVKVHYQGALINGTIFDSSFKRGTPTEFGLNGVIPCWTEGIQKMKVGGKAVLVCPSSIAYGDNGHPQAQIPGGATLVFDVELIEIKGKQ